MPAKRISSTNGTDERLYRIEAKVDILFKLLLAPRADGTPLVPMAALRVLVPDLRKAFGLSDAILPATAVKRNEIRWAELQLQDLTNRRGTRFEKPEDGTETEAVKAKIAFLRDAAKREGENPDVVRAVLAAVLAKLGLAGAAGDRK
jgi:hypothetical protein